MTESSKRPTHFVYATLETGSQDREAKDKWIRLGAGWRNSDGSISCLLDVLPIAWSAGYRGRFKLVVQENQDSAENDGHGRSNERDRGSGRGGGRR
jgi:hypothetical protein